MRVNPFVIAGSLIGMVVKWVVLLAVVLFVWDQIRFRKERRNV